MTIVLQTMTTSDLIDSFPWPGLVHLGSSNISVSRQRRGSYVSHLREARKRRNRRLHHGRRN